MYIGGSVHPNSKRTVCGGVHVGYLGFISKAKQHNKQEMNTISVALKNWEAPHWGLEVVYVYVHICSVELNKKLQMDSTKQAIRAHT